MNKFLPMLLGSVLCSLIGTTHSARAQGTAFTYQGRLTDQGAPANGVYHLNFTLFNAASGGVGLANSFVGDLGITNGLFTVTLDFGAGVFTGADRWLEIEVQTNGAALFTTISPRQPITATPYAIYAGGVTASGINGTIAPVNIGAGSLTTVMLAAGAVGSNQLAAGAVTTGALADGAVTAPKVATVSNWFAVTFANPTPVADDFFGYSVAAVGSDRVLIGAYQDDTGAGNAGAAYLFSANGMLLTTFTNPFPAAFDFFGYSVAALGSDRVLIGAYGDDLGAADAGAAYLFNTNGALLTNFFNPTPVASEKFGWAVAALGSDRVLIGAYGNDTGATDAGAAYLFNANGALLTTFTNPTPAVSDQFGVSVAAVGSDRVLIGAVGDNTGASDAGAAYLFSTNGTLLTTITNPTPAANDFFGWSVAALGSGRVLIGSYNDSSGGVNAGAAYLFSTNGTLLMTFTNPTPAGGDQFGLAVAALGSDRVLIGARLDDTGASDSGAAYLFSTNGTLLNTFTNPTPAGSDLFGHTVAAVGSGRVLIGAYQDDTGAPNAGAAYLFSLETFTPGLVADAVRAGSVTTTSLADGAVTTTSLADGAVTAAKIGGVLQAGQIPNLDASKIAGGTLADARLSTNVALRAGGNAFTGNQTIAGNVGINKTNPATALDVNGTVTAAGLRWAFSELSPDQGGSIELGNSLASGTVPFIDFHYGVGLNQDHNVRLINNASNQLTVEGDFHVTGTVSGNGTGLANVDAFSLGGLSSSNYWTAFGNAGALPGLNFLGTTDDQPLEFRVKNRRALRLEPTGSDSVNVIGGWSGNSVAPGVVGATIGGGGAGDFGGAFPNRVEANFSTVSGGRQNTIQSSAYSAAIAGGEDNTIQSNAHFATIGGGHQNTIQTLAIAATIGGGEYNTIQTGGVRATISGGSGNIITNAAHATIGGGVANWIKTDGAFATIGGGLQNAIQANAFCATIPGGRDNSATNFAFAAGRQAKANHTGAFVWADSTGDLLPATDFASTGDNQFLIRAAGGVGINTNNPNGAALAVHGNVTATSFSGNGVQGSSGNGSASGVYGENTGQGFGIAGRTTGTGSAVYGDNISASGYAGYFNGNVHITGVLTPPSDRNVKRDFVSVDSRQVLEKVVRLAIQTWAYTNSAAIRHLGPVAQDFKAAFDLGSDDKSIATVDADGVALAAIQGLNQKVEGEVTALRAENAELKQRLEKLEQLMNRQSEGGR